MPCQTGQNWSTYSFTITHRTKLRKYCENHTFWRGKFVAAVLQNAKGLNILPHFPLILSALPLGGAAAALLACRRQANLTAKVCTRQHKRPMWRSIVASKIFLFLLVSRCSELVYIELSYYFVPTAVLKKERSGLRD